MWYNIQLINHYEILPTRHILFYMFCCFHNHKDLLTKHSYVIVIKDGSFETFITYLNKVIKNSSRKSRNNSIIVILTLHMVSKFNNTYLKRRLLFGILNSQGKNKWNCRNLQVVVSKRIINSIDTKIIDTVSCILW